MTIPLISSLHTAARQFQLCIPGLVSNTDLPLHDRAHVQTRQEEEQLAVGSQPQLLLRAALQRRQEVDAEEEEGQWGHDVGSQKAVLQKERHHAARGDKDNMDLSDSVSAILHLPIKRQV